MKGGNIKNHASATARLVECLDQSVDFQVQPIERPIQPIGLKWAPVNRSLLTNPDLLSVADPTSNVPRTSIGVVLSTQT
jgi:hypothetical protein